MYPRIPLSFPPASNNATVYFPSSERRLAAAQPAEPAPINDVVKFQENSPKYQKMRLLVSFLLYMYLNDKF